CGAGGAGQCRLGECIEPKLEAGHTTACRLDADGQVACWGQYANETPTSGIYRDLSAKYNGYCAIRVLDNRVVCWGSPATDWAPLDLDAVQISVGYYHACALDEVGEIRCWGTNNNGVVSGAPS